jgi:hypothetical protein
MPNQTPKKRSPVTERERSLRTQRAVFIAISVIMILSMVIALLPH